MNFVIKTYSGGSRRRYFLIFCFTCRRVAGSRRRAESLVYGLLKLHLFVPVCIQELGTRGESKIFLFLVLIKQMGRQESSRFPPVRDRSGGKDCPLIFHELFKNIIH